MALHIDVLPILEDNYTFLLHDDGKDITAIIDPGDSEPVLAACKTHGYELDFILITHHHWDHTGGNQELVARTGCQIVGPASEAEAIADLSVTLNPSDTFSLGNTKADVMDIAGHTAGHIGYYFATEKALFCGDALFIGGCGRVFEGTSEQMWESLDRMRQLPPDTKVYCGHEYTAVNAEFALSLEPDNPKIQAYKKRIDDLRRKDQPTVPGNLGEEIACNPFLRCAEAEFKAAIGMADSHPTEVFRQIRGQRNTFRRTPGG